MKEYVILCYQITQGSADNISEVAVFDSLDKAKAYWKANAATLQDSGHAWSGLTEYHLTLLLNGEYLDAETEGPLQTSASFGGEPPIRKIAR
jgi:hypothetical protein